MSARGPAGRRRGHGGPPQGYRGSDVAPLVCGSCGVPLGFEGHSLTDYAFGRLDACSRCWLVLLDDLAAEGLDLRAYSHVRHLRLKPGPPAHLN